MLDLTSLRIPGVYIDEVPKFPPSIAAVETAIPAFIGYTERADELVPNDLINKPKRIGSLVEFELYYGFGPKVDLTSVSIDDSNKFVSAAIKTSYYMYDSLRMFYSNGGGDCYVSSVGIYKANSSVSVNDFTDSDKGVHALVKFDEPTLLLFPDAVTLTEDEIASVQAVALNQCNDLKDRFCVFDLRENDPRGTVFRNKIAPTFLKYGSAYTPWLKVSLSKNVSFSDVDGKITRGGVVIPLETLTADPNLPIQVQNLRTAVADAKLVASNLASLAAPSSTLRGRFQTLLDTYLSAPTRTVADFQNILTFLYNIARQAEAWVGSTAATNVDLPSTKTAFTSNILNGLRPIFLNLISFENELIAEMEAPVYDPVYDDAVAIGWSVATTFNIATPGTVPIQIPGVVPTLTVADAPTAPERNVLRMNNVVDNLAEQFEALNKIILSSFRDAAKQTEKNLDDSLLLTFPVYKTILDGINKARTTMPPSGAVVGVYARVDRTRGVWKAPANEGLANVIEPATIFTAGELASLNVDVVGGKSINAIRHFTGKGTLVFGARTLAGNDNEWRYVSVRRFFNMVEESTKKATEQFVFEPNDANTWVKVQAMIENFLTTLWRQGAMQGATPEKAFFVSVGLGKTMTPLDILEGRMIIEIGMAVVRPAEFIVLRFMHKLPEA